MIELISKRNRTNKTYYLGGNRYSVDTFIGAVHYKDSLGNWQDIDTNYSEPDSGNWTAQFTKLPYLIRMGDDGVRRIYPDRNDLSYWVDIGKPFANMGLPTEQGGYWVWDYPNATIRIRIGGGAIKLAFILKNSTAPTTISFPFAVQGITRQGNLLYHNGEVVASLRKPVAVDANGTERDVLVSFIGGKVILNLDTTGLVFPIDIDPTIDVSVAASADDFGVYWGGAAWLIFGAASTELSVGYWNSGGQKRGFGMRFLNVNLPNGTVPTVAYLTYISALSYSNTIVNSVIIGEKSASPATFSTLANYQARRGTIVGGADNTQITAASVNWNNIPAHTAGTSYNSPSIVSILTEIFALAGWLGNGTDDVVLFHDDHAGSSTAVAATNRRFASWDHATYNPPALHIEYTSGYSWSVEPLPEVESVYCEALTAEVYDTRRDITAENEASRTQIIADMKVAFPTSNTYRKHTHHHNDHLTSCVVVAV